MNTNTIHKSLGFLLLSFLTLVCFASGAKAQVAPTAQSPELTALIDRAIIENLMADYYSHIGNSSFNFGQYFVKEGVLDVNGIIAKGVEEIKKLYVLASGGAAAAATPKQDPNAPPRGMFNMQLTNLKVEVTGNTAMADMFWSSVESKTLISPPSVTEYGRDHTEFVKQNGHWLIKHRVVTSGGGMPEGELQSYRNMKR
jgi:hypothetical protein